MAYNNLPSTTVQACDLANFGHDWPRGAARGRLGSMVNYTLLVSPPFFSFNPYNYRSVKRRSMSIKHNAARKARAFNDKCYTSFGPPLIEEYFCSGVAEIFMKY